MSDAIHTTVLANDIEFHCLTAGDASQPLALCLHGYPDSAHTWRHLLPQLAEAGFYAVAPFMRGYAPTSVDPRGRYQSGVLGLDANALHQELGADSNAVLIGHDWGALASYSAVALAPQRWKRLVAGSVFPGPVAAEAFFRYEQLRMSWYMFFQLNPLADMVVPSDEYSFIRKLWEDWSPGYDGSVDVDHFIAAMATPENLSAALGYYRQTLQFDQQSDELLEAQTASLAALELPTMYLHGRNDGCMMADLAEHVPATLSHPDSRLEIVENAGHFLQLEQPDVVNAHIIDFVTG